MRFRHVPSAGGASGSGSDDLALSWMDCVAGKTDGVEVTTSAGVMLEYLLNGNAMYRHISTSEDANGYPVDDAFYQTWDAATGVLSDLIAAR